MNWRKPTPRESLWLGLLLVAAIAGLVLLLRGARNPAPSAAPASARRSSGSAKTAERILSINLSRLFEPREPAQAGRRNIFVFGEPPAPPPTPTPLPRPTAVAAADGSPGGASAPGVVRPAALNLQYVGALDDGQGTKIVVLLKDKQEVLTGRVGDVIANRYKVSRVGFESVDLDDVLTGETRRLPLRASS